MADEVGPDGSKISVFGRQQTSTANRKQNAKSSSNDYDKTEKTDNGDRTSAYPRRGEQKTPRVNQDDKPAKNFNSECVDRSRGVDHGEVDP